LGFGVWGLGFGVWGLGFGVWGLGFGVWGLGFGVWGLGFGLVLIVVVLLVGVIVRGSRFAVPRSRYGFGGCKRAHHRPAPIKSVLPLLSFVFSVPLW
jgi:hypothetical protein